MSSHSHTDLTGRSFAALVSEPWDFKSAAGDNRLDGRIVAASPDSAKKPWLLCNVSLFEAGGRQIDRVVLTCRYWKTESLFDDVSAGKRVTVHMFYAVDSGTVDETTADDYLDNPNLSRFLISSIQLQTSLTPGG
ncbi:MAG: hypothetical protein KA118_13120 [Verrucomicrobia bacterium]|nr:hypothetical protein [Verrucomicrobiota bacterium]HOX03815.1 hypothetical protein [Verrucomicrobiota bacterium]